ncbi:MAG: hypothetical protein ACN6O2_15065 [Stenotrophomonas sp.]
MVAWSIGKGGHWPPFSCEVIFLVAAFAFAVAFAVAAFAAVVAFAVTAFAFNAVILAKAGIAPVLLLLCSARCWPASS